VIKQLEVYKDNSKGTYRGIRRDFYPRWRGWALLEDGWGYEELEVAVEEFYITYFFYQMKLDQLKSDAIAFLLLNFATQHGKRKCWEKVQRAVGNHSEGAKLIEEFNHIGTLGEYKLLLEILEFMEYTKSTNTEWVYKVYRTL